MGLPIFGTSNYSNPRWISEPNNRGTWGLLQTCLITLSLCVYSAIHLNVIRRECKWWIRCLIRCKWLVVALLAPEFVVFNAWSQRRQAARLALMLRRRSGQEEIEPYIVTLWTYFWPRARIFDQERCQRQEKLQNGHASEPRIPRLDQERRQSQHTKQVVLDPELQERSKVQEHDGMESTEGSVHAVSSNAVMQEKFDLVHGFVIVMGGLVVDMSRDTERVWPQGCNTLTITPACFEECFEKDAFKDIDLSFLTREQIEGRQKVDRLAKTLIIIQALWFCFQFVVRIWQLLPVSLLELNTFAHSLCALFIYILWWHKPGDIAEPFVIRTEGSEALRDLCAAQWASGASGKHYEGQEIRTTGFKTVQTSVWTPMFVHKGSELAMNVFRGRKGITLCPGSGEDWYIFDHVEKWFYFPRLPRTDRFNLRVRGVNADTSRLKAGQLIPGTTIRVAPQFESVEVDNITLERWSRTFKHEEFSSNYAVWLRDRQPNFAWPRGLDSEHGPKIAGELMNSLFMLLVTSLCYGGLHMLAWQSAILRKTGPDQVFWKLSCLLLMGLGPFALSVWAGLKAWRGADAHLRLNQSMSIVFAVFGVVALLAYLLSRIYLLVETILVIPYMDPGVFQEPDFSVYWPHIG